MASSSVSDEAALRRAAAGEAGGVTRHPSLSFPTRPERQLPKRSSTHSGHLIPARWRRRKKAEVIWHPYVPPATSDQSLSDSGHRPEVTCLISELDERRAVRTSPQGSRHRFSVPSVFVQAPSFRRESPGGARSRKTWADAAPFSRSWDDRNGCWAEPSPSPTDADREPAPADHSPALTDPGPMFPDPAPLSELRPGLVDVGSAPHLLDRLPIDVEPCDTDGELFASARQLEELSAAETSDEDRLPLQPLPAVSSLPDFQRVARPRSATSSLERKHSLPAAANKRVQILEPGEVEELAGRAAVIPGAAAPVRGTPSGSSGIVDGAQGPPGASGPSETPGPSGSPDPPGRGIGEVLGRGEPPGMGVGDSPGRGVGQSPGRSAEEPPQSSVSPSQRRIEARRRRQ